MMKKIKFICALAAMLFTLMLSACGSDRSDVFSEVSMMFEHGGEVDTYVALKDAQDLYLSLSDLRTVLSQSTDSFELKPEQLAVLLLRNEPYNGKPLSDEEIFKHQPISADEKHRSEKKDNSGNVRPYRNSKRFIIEGEEFILPSLNVGERVYFPLTEIRKLLPDLRVSLASEAEDVLKFDISPRFQKEIHLDREYEWYIDQANTGYCSDNNCGPSVAVMAEKWLHPDSKSTAEAARKAFPENDDWWSVTTIVSYLAEKGVTVIQDLYFNSNDLRKHIDAGAIVICCIDTTFLPFTPSNKEGVGRFYDFAGGHFLIVKGYVEIGEELFWETYDPNNWNMTNEDGTPMGKNRRYAAKDLEKAIKKWWNGLLVVYPENE